MTSGHKPPKTLQEQGNVVKKTLSASGRLLPVFWTWATAFAVGCLIAVLSPSLAAQAIWPFEAPQKPLSTAESAAQLLSEMIQTPTVNPPGDERPLAEWLADTLTSRGIEARVIATPAYPGQNPNESETKRGALWARLKGNGSKRPLILLSHLDVVPADPTAWETDPFSGEIRGGWVYGRGALDAKGVTAVHVMTLIELARRNTSLDRDIILLATPDEETGGINGSGYLIHNHSELLQNAEFLLTEGGGVRSAQLDLDGNPTTPAIWGITITEKNPCWIELTTRGQAGHGSVPKKNAAVPRLIAALDRVRRIETPIEVLPQVEFMFRSFATTAPEEDQAGFAALTKSIAEDSSFKRRFLAEPSYNALVRNTISVTVLEGSSRTNVVPTSARAEIDVRLLPGQRCEDFRGVLNRVIADPQVETKVLLSFPSVSSPSDTALFKAIERVAHTQDPTALIVPRMISGFTDAHYFREKGIVAYGFVPRWLEPGEASGVHGVNERISIENLGRGVETLIQIIDEIAAPRNQELD